MIDLIVVLVAVFVFASSWYEEEAEWYEQPRLDVVVSLGNGKFVVQPYDSEGDNK